MMTATFYVIWAFTVIVDAFGQICFKYAALNNKPKNNKPKVNRKFSIPVNSYWMLAGIFLYIIEFFLWIAFLSLVPLYQGVLLGSANIILVMILGRIFFHEILTPYRITGIVLISIGVVIVGAN